MFHEIFLRCCKVLCYRTRFQTIEIRLTCRTIHALWLWTRRCEFLLLGGQPPEEPFYSCGPFAMDPKEQIDMCFRNYRFDQMGERCESLDLKRQCGRNPRCTKPTIISNHSHHAVIPEPTISLTQIAHAYGENGNTICTVVVTGPHKHGIGIRHNGRVSH